MLPHSRLFDHLSHDISATQQFHLRVQLLLGNGNSCQVQRCVFPRAHRSVRPSTSNEHLHIRLVFGSEQRVQNRGAQHQGRNRHKHSPAPKQHDYQLPQCWWLLLCSAEGEFFFQHVRGLKTVRSSCTC